jgi:hypothetical protein
MALLNTWRFVMCATAPVGLVYAFNNHIGEFALKHVSARCCPARHAG